MEVLVKSSKGVQQWRISTGDRELKFTTDQVIDAYEAGLYKGLSITGEIRDKIKKNVERVKKSGEQFFGEVNKDGNKCRSIFLKTDRFDSYRLICILENDVYRDDSLSEPVYRKSWEYEDKLRKDGISLSISFIPRNENLNLNRLKADGYFCYYGELH
jgi:hypothetical protein